MNRMHLVFLTLALFFSIFFHTDAEAQTNAVRINTIPQNPGPFSTVSVSVEDFSRDLNKLNISWTVNGKVVQSGVGLKRLQTTTGALGSATTISINMAGDVQQVVLRPGVVDLVWQSDTYTPPFYKGRALHTNQNQVTVVAEPFLITNQGARLDPTKLVYRWKKNGVLDNNASGIGKQVFRISPGILIKTLEIEVEVASTDNTYRAASTVVIPESKTEVLLYENQPLYGIHFAQVLNGKERLLTEQEMRVVGVPLFFSNSSKTNARLTYSWLLNGKSINQAGNEVVFRKPEGVTSGRSIVGLSIKNTERSAQNATNNFYAVFQNQSNTATSETIF